MIKKYYNKLKIQYYTNQLKKRYFLVLKFQNIINYDYIVLGYVFKSINQIELHSSTTFSIKIEDVISAKIYYKAYFDKFNNIIQIKQYRKIGPYYIENNNSETFECWHQIRKIGPTKIRKTLNNNIFNFVAHNNTEISSLCLKEEFYWNE